MEKALQNKYDYLFSALILVLPFSKAIPNIILGLLLLLLLIDIKKVDFSNLKKSAFILLAVLILFLIVKAIIVNSFVSEFKYYNLLLLLFVVPVLYLKVKKPDLIKTASVFTVNATILLSLLKIVRYYYNYGYLPFSEGWAVNQVLVLERPYAGIFSIISIIISLDLLKRRKPYKWFYIASILVSGFFIFLISARMSMLTLVFLAIIYIFFYFKTSVYYKSLIMVGGLAFFVVFLVSNKNTSNRFFIKENVSTTYEIAKSAEPRVIIWGCAEGMARSPNFNKLTGMRNHALIEENYIGCYRASIDDFSKRNWFISTGYNSHNQFIDFYLIGGLIGIILFVLFICYSLFVVRHDFYGFAIMLSFVFFLLVENVMYRQFGTYIFIIFAAIYLTKTKLINDEN